VVTSLSALVAAVDEPDGDDADADDEPSDELPHPTRVTVEVMRASGAKARARERIMGKVSGKVPLERGVSFLLSTSRAAANSG
jgi:hypothetical protein